MVLIYISLVINHVEHFFICFLVFCIFYLEKCLFKSVAHFHIRWFEILLLSYRSSLCILEIAPLIGYMIYKYLLSSRRLTFHSVYCVLRYTEVFDFVVLSIFTFVFCALCVIYRKSLPNQCYEPFSLCFSNFTS